MPASRPRALWRFLIAAVAGATLVAPGDASAAEKGIQTDISWGISAADQDRTIDALRGTTLQWIRLDISWRQMERTQGSYAEDTLAMTDRSVALAENLGAKIIMSVSETPTWASGSAELNAPPLDAADYGRFVGDMTERYRGRVAAWEIWNEPNHPRFWKPTPDPAGYAKLLQAAAPEVRAADPAAKVMFGGLAHNDYDYLEDVYAAAPDIGKSFDVMATHPYTATGQSPDVVTRGLDGRITKTSFLGFKELRDVMAAHGDERPIWLTEFGWSTNSNVLHPLGGVSETVQAAHLALAFQLLEAIPYVEVAVVYNFRNNYWAGDADTWEDQLGLLRTDFSPKPAYWVFRDYRAPTMPTEQPQRDEPQPAEAPVAAPGQEPRPAPAPASAHALAPEPGPTPAPTPLVRTSAPADMSLSVRRVGTRKTRTGRAGQKVTLQVRGTLSLPRRGRVRIRVQRRSGGRWKQTARYTQAVDGSGFKRTIKAPRGRRIRVTVVFRPTNGPAVRARPVLITG